MNHSNGDGKPPEKPRKPTDEEMFYGLDVSGAKEAETKPVPTAEMPEELVPTPPAPTNGVEHKNGNGNPTVPVVPPAPGLPTKIEDILEMVGEGKTIWDALVAVFGLHEPSYKYLILERTRLNKQEANIVSDALFIVEHGIGTEPFDFAIPELGDWVISRLHAFISVDMGKGNSRDEFREIAASYMAAMKAKAAAQALGQNSLGTESTDRGLQSAP